MSTALNDLISVLCSAVIFVFQSSLLKNRPLKKHPNNPASFFRLEYLLSRVRLLRVSLFYAVPFAVLFLGVGIESQYYIDAARTFVDQHLGSSLTNEAKLQVLDFFFPSWSWFNPVILLIGASILFLPYIRAPFVAFRDLFLFAFGVEARANRFARRGARLLLGGLTLRDAQQKLSDAFTSELPLPAELNLPRTGGHL
jgi:hypothetical protein